MFFPLLRGDARHLDSVPTHHHLTLHHLPFPFSSLFPPLSLLSHLIGVASQLDRVPDRIRLYHEGDIFHLIQRPIHVPVRYNTIGVQ